MINMRIIKIARKEGEKDGKQVKERGKKKKDDKRKKDEEKDLKVKRERDMINRRKTRKK